MAAVTTIAAGGWSTGSTVFSGGSGVGGVPTNADTVTITHAITLDTTAAVCDTLTINASGSLIAQTAGDSKLVVDKTIATATNATAIVTLDMSSVPQYKCEIYCNADTGSNGNGITLSGDFDLKGAPKTAYTYVSGALSIGATSCTVDDATGWRQGDKIVFCTTQAYNSTPRVDVVTLNGSYSDGSTSLTWTGGLTYAHDDNCIAGNFTRNLIIGPNSGSNADSCSLTLDSASRATDAILRDIEFRNCRQSSVGSGGVLRAGSTGLQTVAEISNCAFYEWQGIAIQFNNSVMNGVTTGITRTNNIFYSTVASTTAIQEVQTGTSIGNEYGMMVFRAATGISQIPHGVQFVDAKLSGCTTAAVSATSTFSDYSFITSGSYGGSGIWSSAAAIALAQATSAPIRINTVRLGLGPHATNANYSSANNSTLITTGSGLYDVEFYNCDENISGGTLMSAVPGLQTQRFKFFNRDLNLDTQEIYQNTSTTVPSHSKSITTGEFTRSTSSLKMTFTTSAAVTAPIRDYTVDIPTRSGIAVTIIGYCVTSANYGTSTLPSIALSGLGVTGTTTATYTQVTTGLTSLAAAATGNKYTRAAGDFTADGFAAGDLVRVEGFATAGNNGTKTIVSVDATNMVVAETVATDASAASRGITKWKLLTLTGTQSSGGDGDIVLTFTGQSAVTGSNCWFSGIPVDPFVTRCRHYDYVIDESNPTRVVDLVKSATEATAAAYTEQTFSWSATVGSSTTTIAADTTFQKLYDGHKAQACLNVGSAVALTGAGVAGSPALFASGSVTINTTKTLNGSGSLSIPSGKTLTADVPFAFTYTNGTYSKADSSANATFAGGTLNIGAAGTYTFTQASAMILSMTPTAPGTYALGGNTFTGQVDLRNTSGTHAITVELPTGTSYTTANNTGAAITISTPQLYQSVTVGGIAATYRIQIFDLEYVFTVSGVTVTPTAGATYTNNGITYTVRSTNITAGSGTVICWGTAAPAASGTLTKASGTGDATLTFSAYAVDGTELYIGVPGATSYTWTDGTAAADTRVIRVRIMEDGPGTADAIILIDKIVGTCGTTDGAEALSYLATSDIEADDVYNDRGVDGSAITGITIDDTTLRLEIASGTITNYNGTDVLVVDGRDLYAYETYWLGTTAGMRDEARFIEAIDAVNFRCSNFKLKGTSGYPIMINNCFIVDAATGIFSSMVDYSGDPISNHPEHMKAIVVTTSDSVVTGTLAEFIAAVPTANDIAQEVVTGITF